MSEIRLFSSTRDKTATIKCEVRKETFGKIKLLFEDQRFCDVDLIASVDNFRIGAHQVILSAASEYFQDILQNNEVTEIIIANIKGEILKLLLNFIYTTTIEISREIVCDIMCASKLLKLNAVEEECSKFILRSLDKSHCLSLAVYCKRNNYNELFEKVSMYAALHFSQLIGETEYLQLEIEDLIQLLVRNDLYVRSEEEVFHGIMRWIAHDKTGRECHCTELLSHLRFPLLTPDFIVNEIGETLKAPEHQAIIINALKWHISPSSRTSIFMGELCQTRNQVGKEEVILIKLGTKTNEPIIAEVFDPIRDIWNSKKWTFNDQSGWYTNAIYMQGSLYFACTVLQNGLEMNCVHCFDLETEQLSKLPPMIERRFSFGMVELNGQLYAVGGSTDTDYFCSVEKWDPNSPENWKQVAPMLMKRSNPGVVAFNGLLYAFGSSNYDNHETFEFYDPQTNTWTELKSPTIPRIAVKLCVVKGLLYAVGGWTELGNCTIVQRYDFERDSWSGISSSGMCSQYTQCISWKNRLLVLGEVTEGKLKNIIEEYDPETGKWRTFHSFVKDNATVILISKLTKNC